MKKLPTRKPNRLKNHDYSQNGYYFITMCIKNRHELLWNPPPVGARIARPSLPSARPILPSASPSLPSANQPLSSSPPPLLSNIGEVIKNAIENIPHIYQSVTVDKYVIMPNHIHMILIIENGCGHCDGRDKHDGCVGNDNNDGRAVRAPTVSTVVNQMKGYVTKQIGYSVWQKLFHDHIIRNDADYIRIWQYIDENPMNWQNDCFYPQCSDAQYTDARHTDAQYTDAHCAPLRCAPCRGAHCASAVSATTSAVSIDAPVVSAIAPVTFTAASGHIPVSKKHNKGNITKCQKS